MRAAKGAGQASLASEHDPNNVLCSAALKIGEDGYRWGAIEAFDTGSKTAMGVPRLVVWSEKAGCSIVDYRWDCCQQRRHSERSASER